MPTVRRHVRVPSTAVDLQANGPAAGPARLPVLVGGADSPTGLGVARALRGEDVPVVGLALDPRAPTCRSTLWHEIVPVATACDDAWLDAMAVAARAHGPMVLMPARDDVVAAVAANAAVLRERFVFVMPDEDVVTRLLDKTAFHDWAVREGFPVPRTEIVGDESELADALARMSYPAILKPYERTEAWQAVSRKDKVYRLESAADVESIPFALFDVAPRYVIQEWVPGYDSDVHFCLVYRDRDGTELDHQTGRKIVQWPVETGSTALCVSTDDEELHILTTKLFDAAGLVGVGSLEVKRNRADGSLYITEPTVGRPNLQSNVATAAGVNLTVLAYRDACGLPVPEPARRRGVWVHEATLPQAVVVALRRGRLDAREVLRALRGPAGRAAAYAARGDVGPLLGEVLRRARKVRALVGTLSRTRHGSTTTR